MKFRDLSDGVRKIVIPYLNELLGEENSVRLIDALDRGRPVMVTGANGSGKTTLVKVLRMLGFQAFEPFDLSEVMFNHKLSSPNREKITSMIETLENTDRH